MSVPVVETVAEHDLGPCHRCGEAIEHGEEVVVDHHGPRHADPCVDGPSGSVPTSGKEPGR